MTTKAFSKLLQSTLEDAWEKNIKATSLWKASVDGTIVVEQYASFLRETYHYTKQSALIQSVALPHLQNRNRNLIGPFMRHASEEVWHYKLCVNDLKNLGYSVKDLENSQPLPTTEGYLSFPINRVQFTNPLSYFGYLYNLEYMSIKLGPEFIGNISRALKLDKHQLSFFLAHVEEDKDHVAQLSALVDENVNSLEDQTDVLYTAKTAAALYSVMAEAAFNRPLSDGRNA